MWTICRFALVVTVLCAFTAGRAQALLVEANDSDFGANSVVQDTDTGLDWLKLTFSTNRSFNDVAGQFGAGADFEGWRHATFNELNGLFTSLGYSSSYFSSPSSPQFLNDIQLFGETNTGGAFGFFDDGGGSPTLAGDAFMVQGAFDLAQIFNDAQNASNPQTGRGNWLVRATSEPVTVPEPATILMVSVGIFIIYRLRVKSRAAQLCGVEPRADC